MRIIGLISLVVLIYGCGGIKEADKSADHPNCRSIVEAFYTTDTTYTTKPPFLLLKKSEDFNGTRYLFGDIGSINDSGVVFLRSQKSKFFPFEEIDCLIDSNNHIVYGQWKKDPEVVWAVELNCKRIDVPDSQPFSFILEANQVSSYCIDPGDYKILGIKFNYDEYLDQSIPLNFSRFKVYDNAVTYIGRIHSEYKRNLSAGVNLIPTVIIRRPSQGFAAASMFGAVGGIVGDLADKDNLDRTKKRAGLHGLSVAIDSSYKSIFKGRLPIIQSPASIEDKRPNQVLW